MDEPKLVDANIVKERLVRTYRMLARRAGANKRSQLRGQLMSNKSTNKLTPLLSQIV